ncbi:MipA/OmpV family protein [Dyella solisilvae]|uniref:MipA/OmpV family protein n=1 Tax=Dyella solisilvae TaxID=1920168 RepID=A0A370KBR4_9GAMM|nr:MipA/OmpV family protein [Dyella solisilvae]RDJ00094.1 MipA/OmpV family protein [Dyella solisilvae]
MVHRPSSTTLLAPFLRIALAVLALATASGACADDATEGPTTLLGAGVERMPAWLGSKDHRNQPVPYVQAELPWHITLSTLDGLTVDFIHSGQWRGGFYGNYMWGRDTDELGPKLEGIIDPLSPRLNAGGYLEYQATVQFSVGATLSHDTSGAGAYLNVYGDYDLPAIGYLNHGLQLQWQAMNGAAMRRFFQVTPEQASKLGVAPWSPGGGSQQIELEYDAYMPTSLHTGFALALNYTRLLSDAAASPLVRQFGSANQVTTTLAFVYRF